MPANPCEGTTEDLCGGTSTVGSCQRNPNSPLGFSCGCSQTPGWEAKSGRYRVTNVFAASSLK